MRKGAEFFASKSRGVLFLETCISLGEIDRLNPTQEDATTTPQASSGNGFTRTRPRLIEQLQGLLRLASAPKGQSTPLRTIAQPDINRAAHVKQLKYEWR
jgi:hypothetical protein